MAQFYNPAGPFQEQAKPSAPGFFDTYGTKILGGGMAALQGGLGAYSIQNQKRLQLEQQAKEEAAKAGIQPQQQIDIGQEKTEESNQPDLLQLMQMLMEQKTDSMMGGQMQPQSQQLYQNAFQTANSQSGSQPTPTWTGSSQGPAFLDRLGGGAEYNPMGSMMGMSPEEMVGQGQAQHAENNKSWLRKGANLLGSGLQKIAPAAGMFGPLGWLGGAAAGGIGYGLQQL